MGAKFGVSLISLWCIQELGNGCLLNCVKESSPESIFRPFLRSKITNILQNRFTEERQQDNKEMQKYLKKHHCGHHATREDD